MRVIKKIISLIENNLKIKIGIVVFLVISLIGVLVSGVIYSKNLNEKNLSLKIIKNTTLEEGNKVSEEKDDKNKKQLEEIKIKIKELDDSVDLTKSEGSLDKDIVYYNSLYKELLEKKSNEENKETEEIEEAQEQHIDNVYNGNINTNTNTNINSKPPTNDNVNPDSDKEEPVEEEKPNNDSEGDIIEEPGDKEEEAPPEANTPEEGNEDSGEN